MSSSTLLIFTRGMKTAAIAASGFLIAANVAILSQTSGNFRESVIDVILRIYNIVFAVFIIMAELQWKIFTKRFKFMKVWTIKGAFQIFVVRCILLIDLTVDKGTSNDGNLYSIRKKRSDRLYANSGGVAPYFCWAIVHRHGTFMFEILPEKGGASSKNSDPTCTQHGIYNWKLNAILYSNNIS
jgi:hypothetical protein